MFHFLEAFNDPLLTLEIIRSPPLSSFFDPFNRERQNESLNLKEIESNNEHFIQEKNIKYNLYPLYINWKKIENIDKNDNNYYNIFKLFGYFGVAIFNILNESNPKDNNENYYNHKNFLFELNMFYVKYYTKAKMEENIFFKKIINIYDDVISLIKNKIIIFKEITIFLIVLRLYEKYFLKLEDKNKVLEVLKYEYIIISNIKDEEYKKIYNKYYKKLNKESFQKVWIFGNKYKFPNNRNNYINQLRRIYKDLNKNISQ